MMTDPMKVSEAIKFAVSAFKEDHINTPELDARLLLEGLIGYSHARMISSGDEILPPEIMDQYSKQVSERAAGKPVHRILGKREFFGREFYLNNETLIPRPDTEILVEEALQQLKNYNQPSRILEIGAGSGVIAVTLACELENVEIVATDISAKALEQAKKNAALHNVSDNISFMEADLFDGIEGQFDAIVSNPPYIPSAHLAGLQKEVREHDPVRALDGGIDGLDFYHEIFGQSQNFLKPDGFVCVEIGIGQSDAIIDIATEQEFKVLSRKTDLSSTYRVITAKRA